EDIFQWIENSIAGRYADHILVVHGQRRVGKTSVLKQLGNRLPKRYIPVFFDLQGRTHTTLDHFLWWLARETVRVLKQERSIEVRAPEKDDFARDPEYFENAFLPGLGPAIGDNSLLYTFDEFDNLEESDVKEELARPLTDYLRRLMGRGEMNFIFSIGSSGRKLENMQAAYTEFFKTALYKKISFLSKEQTHGLVTRPVEGALEYERAAVERIYRITSGHPYFTQLTCHELFARCQSTQQRKIAVVDVESVLDDVVERGTVNLKFVWDEASDIEKWSLAALAHLDKADNRVLADFLRKNRVRFSETDLASGLLHLREKDVLTPDNRFVIHLMRLWLQKNRPIEQAREELTEANPIANRFIEIGLEFRDGGDYEKAISYFRQALSVAADNLQAQVNIALAYMAQDQLEQAVLEFEKALALDDEDVASRAGLCEAHLKLGDAAMQKGRLKEAAKSYQRVLAINAEHTEARQRMAEMTRQRAEKALADGRDEEALEMFADALKYTPEDLALVERVEQVRVEKKGKILAALVANSEKEARALNWEAAIKLLEEAGELSPEDADIQNRLAGARQSLHHKKLADLKARAQGLADAERFNDALEAWQEYLRLNPGDREQVEAAIARIEQEQELYEIYTNASRSITARDFDQAIRLLKEVINRDENYKDASRLLTRAIELRRTAPVQKQKEPKVKPERIRKERIPSGAKTSRKFGWIVGGLAAVAIIVLGIFFGPKLWRTISSSPTATTPQASASPEIAGTVTPSPIESIQAYIANTPADFEDDFSSDKWGDLADGVSTKNSLYENVLLLAPIFGTNSEKLVLQGTNIEAAQFALEFDFQFEEGHGGTHLNVGFPSLSDGTTGGFHILLEEQSWTIELDGIVSDNGEITDPLKGQWVHLQVIYFEESIAAFLNGQFLGSADGIDHLGTSTWITARTESGAKIWLDNIKFWNLDGVDVSSFSAETPLAIPSPTPTRTPTPAPSWVAEFAEPILQAIAGREPDFQDDFSSASASWLSEGKGNGNDISIHDGVLEIFYDDDAGVDIWAYHHSGTGSVKNFVLQVTVELPRPTRLMAISMVEFRWNSVTDQGWVFNLYPSGHWQLDYPDPQGNPSNILGTLTGGNLTAPVTITIISKDTGCAIYLDGMPIAYSSEMSPEFGDGIRLGLIGARTDEGEAGKPTNLPAISITYDDITLWNLDGIPNLP
ncbi:MAG: tetratricopeptide repeat protein, partial [Chloroflexi bacterium]|nr:tetratricopeptide repeat protein [Chloroflexota bacterium]